MATIDRSSHNDAKEVTERLIADAKVRDACLNFLSTAIIHADGLKAKNWNINLDPHRKFVRFNVGRVYCIEIFQEKILILCLKQSLKAHIPHGQVNITFKGYRNNRRILSNSLADMPDCLSTVPDSVGCYINHRHLINLLPLMEKPNRDYIEYATRNSSLLPKMRNAHSKGFIEYLSSYTKVDLSNSDSTITKEQFDRNMRKARAEVKRLADSDLEAKAIIVKELPKRIKVISTQFSRNPFVAEFTKRQANGICQDCKQPAPFLGKESGEPFLETHHIIPLADGGEDSIENTIALCPNCHRKRHYG